MTKSHEASLQKRLNLGCAMSMDELKPFRIDERHDELIFNGTQKVCERFHNLIFADVC